MWANFIVAPTSIVKDSLSASLPLSAAEQKQPNKKELEKLFAWSDFNVQHSDIKSDGKVHVKDLYIFSSVRKSKSLYEKDLKLNLSPEIRNDPECIFAHMLMFML